MISVQPALALIAQICCRLFRVKTAEAKWCLFRHWLWLKEKSRCQRRVLYTQSTGKTQVENEKDEKEICLLYVPHSQYELDAYGERLYWKTHYSPISPQSFTRMKSSVTTKSFWSHDWKIIIVWFIYTWNKHEALMILSIKSHLCL